MATFIMLPDGVTGTNQWQKGPGGGTCAGENVDNDNDDTEYCYELSNNEEVTFTLADPGVAEAAIDSITSVQIKFKARYTAPSGNVTMRSYQTGTGILNGLDSHTIGFDPSFTLYSGTVRNGPSLLPSSWSYSYIENLRINLLMTANAASRTMLSVSYLYALVTYVEVTGYGNDVNGIDSGDIDSINGIATADISKVNGV